MSQFITEYKASPDHISPVTTNSGLQQQTPQLAIKSQDFSSKLLSLLPKLLLSRLFREHWPRSPGCKYNHKYLFLRMLPSSCWSCFILIHPTSACVATLATSSPTPPTPSFPTHPTPSIPYACILL